MAPTSREINSQDSFSSGEKTCVGLLTISIENAGRLIGPRFFIERPFTAGSLYLFLSFPYCSSGC